jgi:hypothetical protein
MMKIFGQGTGKKDPGESVILAFDFSKDMTSGETLTGTPAVAITLYSGTVDSGMAAMLSGAAQISGNLVLQMVGRGQIGNQYMIEATCATSAGRVLVLGGILPIIYAALQ